MAIATTRTMLTHIGFIGAAVLGCATARHDADRDRAATLRGSSAQAVVDRSSITLPRSASDVLTAAELSTAPGYASATLYEVVLRLRPTFLNPRDARVLRTLGRDLQPAVFVDGMYYGGLEALRTLPAFAVVEMQYIRAMDAMHRYGPRYEAGVILVRLRR